MLVNTVLIIISATVFAIMLFSLYFRARIKTQRIEEEDFTTIEQVLEAVKQEMVEIVKEDYYLGLSDAEFNALYKRKARINEALKNCVHGIDSAKVIVLELIRGFIAKNVPKERVAELLGLAEGMEPTDHTKFEILMYRYKKKYGKKALSKWIDKYDLARERVATGAVKPTDQAYYITIEDLHSTYEKENIQLSEEEQIDILAILVYQQYKGFGILDTLREMDINGFNCGTSGSIMSNYSSIEDGTLKATNSVWLYYQGKYIHLRFMNFGSEDELKRIIQLMVRYGNPGPLTAKRGYMVNTMYDKSRVLALRPPASEYWAIFVRKFTLDDLTPEWLICKPDVTRGDLAVSLIEYLIRGNVTSSVTGRQGSGKTTLMASIMRYINPRYTLRVLEMAPELYLRELYPSRNILSVQETEYVTPEELQDALKKSDAAVSIVGEVASDKIAARMIQLGMVASIFTIFSHHANTAKDLVYALRNSLVNAAGFDMRTAEKQVTDIVKIDIHMDYTPDGTRYIERITEIIQLDESIPYPEYDPNDPHSMNKIMMEYFNRRTDRLSFRTQDILRYDIPTKTYYVVNRPSVQLENYIRRNLGELRDEYDKFMFLEWGRRKDLEEGEIDEVYENVLCLYADVEIEGAGRIKDLPEEEQVKVISELIREERKMQANTQMVDRDKQDALAEEEKEDAMLFFDFFDGGDLVR